MLDAENLRRQLRQQRPRYASAAVHACLALRRALHRASEVEQPDEEAVAYRWSDLRYAKRCRDEALREAIAKVHPEEFTVTLTEHDDPEFLDEFERRFLYHLGHLPERRTVPHYVAAQAVHRALSDLRKRESGWAHAVAWRPLVL